MDKETFDKHHKRCVELNREVERIISERDMKRLQEIVEDILYYNTNSLEQSHPNDKNEK